MQKQYFAYILTTRDHTALYTGVTNNLIRRHHQHKMGLIEGFTKRYFIKKLVYFEVTEDIYAAIAREKQIKAGSRRKKLELINSTNPEWRDLSEDFK